MKGLYAWVGFKSVGFEFTPPERFAGMTHFPFKRLFWLAVDGVTSFSNMPLRLWSLSGAFLPGRISVLYGPGSSWAGSSGAPTCPAGPHRRGHDAAVQGCS